MHHARTAGMPPPYAEAPASLHGKAGVNKRQKTKRTERLTVALIEGFLLHKDILSQMGARTQALQAQADRTYRLIQAACTALQQLPPAAADMAHNAALPHTTSSAGGSISQPPSQQHLLHSTMSAGISSQLQQQKYLLQGTTSADVSSQLQQQQYALQGTTSAGVSSQLQQQQYLLQGTTSTDVSSQLQQQYLVHSEALQDSSSSGLTPATSSPNSGSSQQQPQQVSCFYQSSSSAPVPWPLPQHSGSCAAGCSAPLSPQHLPLPDFSRDYGEGDATFVASMAVMMEEMEGLNGSMCDEQEPSWGQVIC